MLPRLKLARDLLRDDGVIFISIDDNEQANLKLLCDEIFGEENFCGQIIWLKGNAQNDADTIQRNQEYILCYAKNIESKPINALPYKEKVKAFRDEKTGRFYYEGAGFVSGNLHSDLNHHNLCGYTIYYNPLTQDIKHFMDYDVEKAKTSNSLTEVYKPFDTSLINNGYQAIRPPQKEKLLGRWVVSFETFADFIMENRILIKAGKNGYSVLRKEWLDSKQVKKDDKGDYYAMVDKESPPKSFIDFAGSGRGTTELKQVFNAKIFNNPKNTILLKHLLKIATTSPLQCGGGGGNSPHSLESQSDSESTPAIANRKDNGAEAQDIILDFFAGSGTTAHAVMQLNAEDGGKRRFILVQLDEAIDPSKAKTAYDFCKNELGSENPVISDITIERVKRASSRILESHKGAPLELGFRVFSMVEKPSLISDELGSLKLRWRSELSPRDKARNLSLFDNKMLHVELQEIIKDSLYQCEQSFYIVALNDEVLARLKESESEEVYISGYDITSLQSYKNLESLLTSRLKVVY